MTMFDCQTSFCYFTVFEVLREWVESYWTVISFWAFFWIKTADKICWTGFTEEYALTTHYTATKYCTGSQVLVFPRNLLLSSQSSCVKPVRIKISCRSVSCAAYKYSLITGAGADGTDVTVASLHYVEVHIDGLQTVYTVLSHLCYDHSPTGSICQRESGGLHSRAPSACGVHALYPLLVPWLHTSK